VLGVIVELWLHETVDEVPMALRVLGTASAAAVGDEDLV
jgi:hypothetical protein